MTAWQHAGSGRDAGRRRRVWVWAALLSFAGHVVAVPLAGRFLAEKPAAKLEVSFLTDERDETASTDNPIEPTTETPMNTPQPMELAKTLTEPDKPDEPVANRSKPQTPETPKPEVKPLELTVAPHLKMVDQEQFPDEDDNQDARYLAQKNHRAAVDAQANERNLIRAQAAEAVATSPSENRNSKIGDAEQKSAELQDRPGDKQQLPRLAPPTTPTEQQPNLAVAKNAVPSKTQQTEAAPGQAPTAGEKTALGDGSQQLAGGGNSGQGQSLGKFDRATGLPGTPGLSPSRLRHQDYDRIVGYDVAEAERRAAARAERSQGLGRWDRMMAKQALFRSALENFTPHVRVGNQSELGTRAHPFAAYIAQVHRQIHRFWGDGFLADLDRKTGQDIYPRHLVTALELSIRPDGTLVQAMIAKTSGVLPFDAAAIDAVASATPFGEPPSSIKSRDGNVYITWYFHRDERQCATDFVNAHILTTPPKTEALAASKTQAVKARETASGAELLDAQPGFGLPTGNTKNRTQNSAGTNKTEAVSTDLKDKKHAADRWLAGYEQSDIKRLSAASALPFTSGGKTVAQDAGGLRVFFEEMLAEGVARPEKVLVYTRAEAKARLGRAPRGSDADEAAFVWVEQNGEDLLLVLEPTEKGWKVVGLDR